MIYAYGPRFGNITCSNYELYASVRRRAVARRRGRRGAAKNCRTATQSVSQSAAATPEYWFVEGKLLWYLIYCKATHGCIQENTWMPLLLLLCWQPADVPREASLSSSKKFYYTNTLRHGMNDNKAMLENVWKKEKQTSKITRIIYT